MVFMSLTVCCLSAAGETNVSPIKITKLGTIDIDLVETTPIVFKNKAYRYEYVRANYWDNKTGDSYSRFIDLESGAATPSFAKGHHLGSAAVDGDLVLVTAVNRWDGEKIDIFTSCDLETWESWNALTLPGYGIFNTSLCRDKEGFILMFEVGKPEEIAGTAFTARFAKSSDLKSWALTPDACNYDKGRYTAPHCLRFHNGYYYNFFLEAAGGGYEQHVVRSKDLMHWQPSPLNPILRASEEDKGIANPKLTERQQKRIREARNINNSDFDYCEFKGELIINYSWGDQQGTEHLAEARFAGTEEAFLNVLFPSPNQEH